MVGGCSVSPPATSLFPQSCKNVYPDFTSPRPPDDQGALRVLCCVCVVLETRHDCYGESSIYLPREALKGESRIKAETMSGKWPQGVREGVCWGGGALVQTAVFSSGCKEMVSEMPLLASSCNPAILRDPHYEAL